MSEYIKREDAIKAFKRVLDEDKWKRNQENDDLREENSRFKAELYEFQKQGGDAEEGDEE